MPADDEAEAVAVLLPAPEAARAAVELWEAGEAVVPLDPAAPAADLRRSLDAFRPTALIDGDGRRRLPDGIPVAAGVAAVIATSGTTGERKGVELTFSGLAASGAAVAQAVGGTAGWLCCLPVHLVAGLAVVGRAWVTGASLTVHPGFDPAAVGEAARQGVAFVSLVPTMLRRLLDAAPEAAAAFDHILLGGGSIDPALLERARAAGATVSTTYGMTETWGGVVHNGHPLPGVELRLDSPGAPANHDAGVHPDPTRPAGRAPAATAAGMDDIGEILVRAPMLMRGYRLWPEGTAAAIDAEGWYRTGDLGRFDAAAGGRLWVVDRLGDVVNTGGVKVSPTEVERVLARHPAIADICIAGRPDPDWGQRVVAFVVPAQEGAPPSLDDLRSFAREHLPAAKLPREVVLVPAIPRTPGGKPLRRLLPAPT
ncbi:MAG: fatty acid--CoA ligase family protein [Actinomycetota bacterium]|jgi:o-succinylbenzoate---CoA ligase